MKTALGIDFGTNSVRALIVDVESGTEVGTAVADYGSGEHGVLLDNRDPLLARQNPLDYEPAMREAIAGAIAMARQNEANFHVESIVGIGVDATASSPIPVDENGIPLAQDPEFAYNLSAQCWLWKDHTAHEEAEEINQLAKQQDRPYLTKCGGSYSSEWFWAKVLRCARTDSAVFEAAYSWIELQDFIPALLTGTLSNPARGMCAAGHKGMYHQSWGGWPDDSFLSDLHPGLARIKSRLAEPKTSNFNAGHLVLDVGLPLGIPVAVGLIDAHAGGVGSGVRPGTLVKIMGTSTCDILVGDETVSDIQGVSGVVPGSVIPEYVGVEAGQAAVGDLFNWFATRVANKSHEELADSAATLRPGQSGLIALDWNNGNRNPLSDSRLVGLIIGQTLHTTDAEIYRALIEATAFGARMTMERIESYGVPINEVIMCGGIAEKSPLTMQIYADVCNRPMKLAGSSQACALGAAVFGAVVGGAYQDTLDAISAMTSTKDKVYVPDPKAVSIYDRLYDLYVQLFDAFGRKDHTADLGTVMKHLIRIRTECAG